MLCFSHDCKYARRHETPIPFPPGFFENYHPCRRQRAVHGRIRSKFASQSAEPEPESWASPWWGWGSLKGTHQIAPALQKTKFCRLAGIVTGTPDKAKKWQAQYNLPAKSIYNYDTMEQMADNPDIDVVYVVTPNALHAEHTIKAAKAGKHVLCEKPMEVSSEKCTSR